MLNINTKAKGYFATNITLKKSVMVTRRGDRQKSKRNQFNNRNDAKILSERTKRLINM